MCLVCFIDSLLEHSNVDHFLLPQYKYILIPALCLFPYEVFVHAIAQVSPENYSREVLISIYVLPGFINSCSFGDKSMVQWAMHDFWCKIKGILPIHAAGTAERSERTRR